jgi:hypothetical protein
VSCLPLEIAGVRVDVVAPPAEPIGLARYRPFARAAGRPSWTLELGPAAYEAPVPPGRTLVERGGRWRIFGLEDAGWLDPATGTGAASLDSACLLLDTLLRAAVAKTVLDEGGLLVHGAAIVVGGAAHLFPARSGSGKSTLAARAAHPLSDELSILRPNPGGFEAHASPWWVSNGGSAPLACIYELAWDGEGVTPLHRTAVRQLATNLVLPLDAPESRGQALAAAAMIAGATPFARFAFHPESDVDALLRGPSPAPAAGARGVG